VPVKVGKNSSAGFASGLSGTASSRGAYMETEPVHTIVADRDAMPHGQFAAERRGAGGNFRRQTFDHAPPAGMERRKYERRQRQIDVLLDTRVSPGRRQQASVDEEA
jgi:hypothetical protein